MTDTQPAARRASLNGRPIAQLQELWKVYAKPGTDVAVEALRGVNLDIEEGEYMAITGPSGSGKSTLMNILGCLDRPSHGYYALGGEDVSTLDDNALSEIRGQRLGFVFQSFNLIAQLTVLENVEVPLFYLGLHRQERHKRAMRMIELVELADRVHHRPTELSGGQQQRVAIARALANEPLMILADEPTGNLDTKTGQMIMHIFDELNGEGRTIVLVTHEPEIANHCKRTIGLRDGLIVTDTAAQA
jgi:putative ABC transport system ATP-binding protein